MPLSAWTRRLGLTQGRIQPINFIPPEGLFVFAMGSDIPSAIEDLVNKAGNVSAVSVAQTAIFGTTTLMRFRGRIRPPKTLPAGCNFKAAVLVNGTERVSQLMTPGWLRTINDWAINIAHIGTPTTPATIEWQLSMVGTNDVVYTVELPAFYVDAVTFQQPAVSPIVANRMPEPGEIQVPLAAPIRFDLMDVTNIGIDSSTVQAYVNGVLAFSGGAFQTGFTGTASFPQADTYRVSITPTIPFVSQEVVTVRATGSLAGGAQSIDTSWLFTAVDLTAPQIVTAAAQQDQFTVRVVFDTQMQMLGAAGANDALNPSNYAFTPLTFPAVTLTPVSVAPASPEAVDITVQWPMTPNATYQVAAQNVADVLGNVIAPPFNAVTFLGFQPPIPPGRSFNIWNGMIPGLAKRADDGTLYDFCACFQEVVDLFQYEIDRFRDFLDPDRAEEYVIDLMLADMGNPFLLDLDLQQKRKLLSVLKTAMLESGSPPGNENLVRLFMDLDVQEVAHTAGTMHLGISELGFNWVLGPSGEFQLYAFDMIAPRVLTAQEQATMRSLVNYNKAGWTHFVNILQPQPVPPTPTRLQLGVSLLGMNWILN
jgi:phage tail-like protein